MTKKILKNLGQCIHKEKQKQIKTVGLSKDETRQIGEAAVWWTLIN